MVREKQEQPIQNDVVLLLPLSRLSGYIITCQA